MIIQLYDLKVCVDQISFLVEKTKFRQKIDSRKKTVSNKKTGSSRKPDSTANLSK
jgi:hypothetical protein